MKQNNEELFNISPNHCILCHYRERVTRKQLKSLLLREGDKIFYGGDLIRLKSKHIGSGIYELYKDL
jgi:hypothetical protein